MNFRNGGKGVAIGGIATNDEFQCYMPARFSKSILDKNNRKINEFQGRVNSINFAKSESEYGTIRFDMLTSNVTDMADDPGDGFVITFFWDNNGNYDSQLYIPNSLASGQKPKYRSKSGTDTWGAWNDF